MRVGLEFCRAHFFQQAVTDVLAYVETTQMPHLLRSPEAVAIGELVVQERLNGISANRRFSAATIAKGRRTSIAQSTGLTAGELLDLRNVLRCQSTARYFKDFCMRRYVADSLMMSILHKYLICYCSYCAESLYFWLDVEDYQNLPRGSEYMNRIALKIYQKYIEENSKLQVNIPDSQRKYIADTLLSTRQNSKQQLCPNRYVFKRVR